MRDGGEEVLGARVVKITYICYHCSCGSADACGFVHHTTYMSEEEVKRDMERGW